LGPFLNDPRPDWTNVCWISVDGLTWDVIKLLGNHKHLHRLAIEGLMNAKNGTKAVWYSDYTFTVLQLRKLIQIQTDSEDCDSNCDDWDDKMLPDHAPKKPHRKRQKKRFWPFKTPRPLIQRKDGHTASEVHKPIANESATSIGRQIFRSGNSKAQTIQRYLGEPNEERILYMERHSALASKGLAVAVEQVAIFLKVILSVSSSLYCQQAHPLSK